MVICRKCKANNPPEADRCEQCGANLLPGESLGERALWLVGGIIGTGLSAGMLYLLSTNPESIETSEFCLFTNPVVWMIGIFVFPISGLVSALRKTPLYKRYENRAKRHINLDWEQALTDFSKAIELAPKKVQASLLKQRADVYKAHGMEDDYLTDRLEYMESEGAYQGQADFAQVFKLDSDQFITSARDSERKRLVAEGKIHAVGFCKKCRQAVTLNAKIRCPDHPKSKPLATRFTLPKDLELVTQEVETKGAKTFAKQRTIRIVLLVTVLAMLVFCIAIPLLMNSLQ